MPSVYSRDSREQLIALIDLFDAMWNTQNVSGVLACFSEDAVVTVVGFPSETSTSYRGTKAILDLLEIYLPGWHVHA